MLLFAAGCGKRESVADAGVREGIMHFGNGSEPRNLDPSTVISITESNILGSLFEGLVRYSPDCTGIPARRGGTLGHLA